MKPAQRRLAWALLPLLAGAALRFYALGSLPHGVYHDEAYYGLDAVSVLNGAHPIFFTANNGREPLYIYLLSLSVGAFGRTPFGLRFVEALIGTATIAASYRLGRRLFNPQTGLLAMWICAGTFWALALSRISFRAGLLPLVLGLAAAWGWQAWRQKRLGLAVLAGAAYGLSFNTYTASRATPLALAAYGLLRLWAERRSLTAAWRPAVRVLAGFSLALAIVIAPLGVYALIHPEQVFAREGQVSIFETESGSPALILLRHIGLGLGMFTIQGDSIARHNLPGRPVFDALMSIFFLLGLSLCLARLWRRRKVEAEAFLLLWIGAGLVPTILAQDTPHYLRSIAMLPALWLLPAIGLDAFVGAPWPAALPAGFRGPIAAGLLLVSTLWTTYDYFLRYVHLPVTDYYFEYAATDLAAKINSRPGFSNRIDDRLWDNFASLRFLVADRAGAAVQNKVQLAVWPYEAEAVHQVIAGLPTGSEISAEIGPLARGDLENTPYSLYTLYIAQPTTAAPLTARFSDVLELRGASIAENAGQAVVSLKWSLLRPASVDYHVYVHVLTNGELTAQWDGEPLQNQFHFTWLRPGDVLADEVRLADGDHIQVGVYAPDGTPLGAPADLK